MEFKQCERGHFYDPSVTPVCPQCQVEGNASDFASYGATTPPGEFNVSSGVSNSFRNYSEATLPPNKGNGGFSPSDFNDSYENNLDIPDGPTQPPVIAGVAGFAPVVGWLVCIDGPAHGMDYRIRPGYNYIGSSEHNDIYISGDKKISRDRHAMIAYDHEERVFFFGPADGKSIVRLNKKMVMIPEALKAYDVITIGTTKLMFVPLCGEKFNWE